MLACRPVFLYNGLMKKKFDIITIGGTTLDIMFNTDRAFIIKGRQPLIAFPLGSKISSKDVLYTTGGGAANTAVSFAKLGFKVAGLMAVGKGANARIVINRLIKEGVDISLVQRVNAYTGLSFIVTGGGKREHVIFTHRSANDSLVIKSASLNYFKVQWFYLASLSGQFWRKNLKTVFTVAQKQRIKVAWNPGSAQIEAGCKALKRYLQETEVLLLNKEEAVQLVKSSGVITARIPKLFKVMLSWGPKVIAITQGGKDAFVCSGKNLCFHKALKARGVVNTTGAGDAFGSSLVGGLILYQSDLKKALKLAIIRSSYVIRKVGAQEGLLTLGQVKSKNR